jgi:hypothetical protein
MTRATLLATSFGTATALLFPACSDLPPGQPGPFANGAVAGGNLARGAMVTSAEAQATGSTTGTVVSATIVILAKHQATEAQRRVAQANARTALARLRKQPSKKAGAKTASALPPRYLAVDTLKDDRTAPQAERSIVIFDTETQEIVGNKVYDVKSTPPVGGTAKFETFTAEYVGSGS